MYAQNDVNYVCKIHNVILLILLTLLEKLATLLTLLKNNQQLLKFSPGLEPRCARVTLRLCRIVYKEGMS